MSGLEVAGVVLGAFPIAITALDKYREVARLWGFWWEIRSEYQKCSSEVKFHRLSFNRNLKQLLLPMVADDEQIQRLLANPGGDEWRQKSIGQQLEDRLQDSYELYLEIIQQLQRTMQELGTELSVDKSEFQDNVSSGKEKNAKSQGKHPGGVQRKLFTKPKREYELYRLKFALGEAKRKELFAELKEYNERLEKLLTTSDTIAELRSRRKSHPKTAKSTMDMAAAHFWRHADRLYKVLSRAWNCNCASRHRANILLRHKALADLEFMLLFLDYSNDGKRPSSTWHLRETKVKLLDPPPMEKLFTQITIMSQNKNKTKPCIESSRDRALTSLNRTNSKQCTVSITDTLVPTQASSSSSNAEIQSLCQTLASKPPVTDSYGFLEDDHKRYYIYPTSHADFTLEADKPVTLDDLLRRKHQPPLSRRQRYTLALTLASSFLQLWESAWLTSGSWGGSDISFLKDADNSRVILLDRPYITRNFSAAAQPNQADPLGIPLLGILLLELCFGRLIEEDPSRQQYPSVDTKMSHFFDQLVAAEWLREVVDEAGPDYTEAATWCLVGSRSLGSGDDWRRMLFEKVVQPLERCHLYLNPGLGSSAQSTV